MSKITLKIDDKKIRKGNITPNTTPTPPTIFSEFMFDYTNMLNTFEDFQRKLHVFLHIQKGDKLGFTNNDVLYLDYSGIMQSMRRWYYNQNREVTARKLKTLLEDYIIFLNLIISSCTTGKTRFIDLAEEVNIFNQTLMNGLDHLYVTYEKEPHKLKTIIITYKRSIERLYERINNDIKNKTA